MAKTCQVYRDNRRKEMIDKYAARRAALRKQLKDPSLDPDEKEIVQAKLEKLPRNSCPTRRKNRCQLTGRPRGYYRKFGLSRIALRDLALQGKIPGVIKSSW